MRKSDELREWSNLGFPSGLVSIWPAQSLSQRFNRWKSHILHLSEQVPDVGRTLKSKVLIKFALFQYLCVGQHKAVGTFLGSIFYLILCYIKLVDWRTKTMLLLTPLSLSLVSVTELKNPSDPVKNLKKATRFPVFFLVGFTLIKYTTVKLHNSFRCLCQLAV